MYERIYPFATIAVNLIQMNSTQNQQLNKLYVFPHRALTVLVGRLPYLRLCVFHAMCSIKHRDGKQC